VTLREPQQDRSRATRQRLLEAAVDCLAEVGWTGTTVAVVAERAGVSRGAAQHHFPTREDLFTVALDHMSDVRLAELRDAAARLPAGSHHTEGVVHLIVRIYTSSLFRAALQLWLAASADEALRARVVPLEQKIGRVSHQTAVELLGVDESHPGVRELVQGTLDMARGLALANILKDDSRRRRQVVRHWAETLDAALAATADKAESVGQT
jgi:AcrR family transcriptional regulator